MPHFSCHPLLWESALANWWCRAQDMQQLEKVSSAASLVVNYSWWDNSHKELPDGRQQQSFHLNCLKHSQEWIMRSIWCLHHISTSSPLLGGPGVPPTPPHPTPGQKSCYGGHKYATSAALPACSFNSCCRYCCPQQPLGSKGQPSQCYH